MWSTGVECCQTFSKSPTVTLTSPDEDLLASLDMEIKQKRLRIPITEIILSRSGSLDFQIRIEPTTRTIERTVKKRTGKAICVLSNLLI